MKPRALLLALTILSGDFGCSTTVPPNGVNGRCESDDQCDHGQGLVCRCIRRKNPDEEGDDQIISPGYCEQPTYSCSDSGTAETGAVDTGAAVDTGTTSETGTTDSGTTDSSTDVSSGG